MSKKTKATLYLEEDIVKRAKESDLNISKIANTALKERFGLERETSKQRNLRELLQEAEEEDRLYSLPFQISKFEIENIRKFDELTLDFEDGLNIIHGPNSSGKSTIIETIVNTIAPRLRDIDKEFIKYNRNRGKASIELQQDSIVRRFTPGTRYDEGDAGLLLLDDPFVHLDDETTSDLLDQLKETIDSQIILTTIHSDLADQADNSIRLHTYTEERRTELKQKISNLENTIDKKKERLMDILDEIEELEMNLEELKASKYEIESLEEKRASIQDSIDKLENEADNLEGRMESVEEQLEDADSEREIGRLEERKHNLRKQLSDKENQLEMYHDELEEIENELKEAEDISQKSQELRSTIEHKRTLKHNLEEEIEDLHKDLEHLMEEKKEIDSKMEATK